LWSIPSEPDGEASFQAKLAANEATMGDTVNVYLDWRLAARQCFAQVGRYRQWNIAAQKQMDAVSSTTEAAVPQGTNNGSAQGNGEASPGNAGKQGQATKN
jgi:hypothetical protein